MPLALRLAAAALSLVLGAAVWLPTLRLWHRRGDLFSSPSGPPPTLATDLAARHLRLWNDPVTRAREVGRMRRSNAEWDFMGRTYLVLALADLAARDPARRARYLATIDRVVEDTLAVERAEGMYFFLMPYARARPWVVNPGRSLFVDGELALMLGARRLVEEHPRYREEHVARAEAMAERLARSPTLSGESYPDECWTFCNTVALAAIRMHDVLDGTDHRALARAWVEHARAHLTDPRTGLLVSAYTLDGRVLQGPEGSSIFMVAHDLQAIDPDFARDQYRRARRALGRDVLGFAYATEWPEGSPRGDDIDSGPTIPILGASAGASGLALLGAGAFGDRDYLSGLVASLDLAAFPSRSGGELRYLASNQVGDAVLLYALVQGPLWRRLQEHPR